MTVLTGSAEIRAEPWHLEALEVMEDAPLAGFARAHPQGGHTIDLLVDGVYCAGCIERVEGAVRGDPAVRYVRLNLTLRRLVIVWDGPPALADRLARAVRDSGYRVAAFLPDAMQAADDAQGRELARALGIAGFAAGNTMMLAMAIWSGQASDMAPATQALLQGLSGLITLPAVIWAGQPFFRSAWRVLRGGGTNIDVPISAAVLLTAGMSAVQMLRHGHDVYFDSAATLLLVLLAGRLLDHRVRARARGAIERLALLRARGALVRRADGSMVSLPADQVCIDDIVLVRPGERVAADGVVLRGESSLDVSLITGESTPVPAAPGTGVLAGTLNGGGALEIQVRTVAEQSHLADIVRLVEAAESRRGRHVMLADRVVRWWTPCIHTLAAATFAAWLLTGHDGFTALLVAVSVLIIACPCAIGLAVPAVQVVATTALMRAGVLVRAGDALERLAAIDTVVFDKTGTLTYGRELVGWPDDPRACALAAGLAAGSTHPVARAIRANWPETETTCFRAIVESPGGGLAGQCYDGVVRLGGRAFCGLPEAGEPPGTVWLTRPGAPAAAFQFHERLREDARSTLADLRAAGLRMSLLSGDHPANTAAVAGELDIPLAEGGANPLAKVAALVALAESGARVLMVGDGLNDAPALAAAHVSASFAHGAGASQAAADLILPGEKLGALLMAHRLARRALGIVRQNLVFALLYNIVLIPLAMCGWVTPLTASVAMSLSSLTVTLNALRAGRA